MLKLNKVHHIAIICTDYERSKEFYTGILGFSVVNETYRPDRGSYKLDLALNGQYVFELFSFPAVPGRASYPEAAGLRHIAFEVDNINEAIGALAGHSITAEPVRTDEITGKRFTFIKDPDNLPIELYEK